MNIDFKLLDLTLGGYYHYFRQYMCSHYHIVQTSTNFNSSERLATSFASVLVQHLTVIWYKFCQCINIRTFDSVMV